VTPTARRPWWWCPKSTAPGTCWFFWVSCVHFCSRRLGPISWWSTLRASSTWQWIKRWTGTCWIRKASQTQKSRLAQEWTTQSVGSPERKCWVLSTFWSSSWGTKTRMPLLHLSNCGWRWGPGLTGICWFSPTSTGRGSVWLPACLATSVARLSRWPCRCPRRTSDSNVLAARRTLSQFGHLAEIF